MKKLLVFFFLSFWIITSSFAQSQKKQTLEGAILLEASGEPIIQAQILIKELGIWGFSNNEGLFKIAGIIPGSYTLEASCLGYQKISVPINILKDISGYKIYLKEDNLKLEDVIVTAKAGNTMNSSSKISKQAIEHIQATSLSDLMQLLPGSITSNPTLTSKNFISIRSITNSEGINSSGVGVLINGSKISNDASLYEVGSIDFRNIATDNIESVEVLKGVLSAEYGDMTSGAVIVTTKTGRTPLEFKIKADPRTKAISFSKGFSVGKDAGYINIDADYARAYTDWRSPVNIFDRTTLSLTYSNTFNVCNAPFRFNTRVSGYLTGNSITSDPDAPKENFTKSKDNNISLAIYGSWALNKSWITTLNYNVSGNYSQKYLQDYKINNSNPVVSTNIKDNGVFWGYYTKITDVLDMRSEDEPLYVNAKLNGILNKKFAGVLSKTNFGIEWNTKGNTGKGTFYAQETPQFFRSRSFSEIPFLSDLSLFLDEKISVPIGKTSLEMNAGVRFNKMIISGYNYDPSIDPRLNIKYNIIKDKKSGLFRGLSIRGGWGILQHLPSIAYLYPENVYLDRVLFQYSDGGVQKAAINTQIIDGKLPYNLKPVKTNNTEVGIDFNLSGIETQISFFKENITNGISDNYTMPTYSYELYKSYTASGLEPKIENGKVYIKNNGVYTVAEYNLRREFMQYSRPDNRGAQDKWGIEWDINLGKIHAINTSVIINGAYIKVKDYQNDLFYYKTGTDNDPIDTQSAFPYISVWSGDQGISNGTQRERLNTNISLVTNVPKFRLVVSLTAQCILINRSWFTYDTGNIYSEDANGQPVYGDYNNKINNVNLYRDPIAYIDFDGNIRPFSDYHTSTDANLKRRLSVLRASNTTNYFFTKTTSNPYMMLNLRVTKEIGEMAALSFYANNFTNSMPIMKNNSRPNVTGSRKNTEIYFGAELKLTF